MAANPFQDFIQLELPKRPYLETDVAQETVFVRRGPGPRQMQSVALAEGEVLGLVDGTLQGIASSATGITQNEVTPVTTWTITHNKNNDKAIVQAKDAAGNTLLPDSINISANEIVLTFTAAQAGTATVLFF